VDKERGMVGAATGANHLVMVSCGIGSSITTIFEFLVTQEVEQWRVAINTYQEILSGMMPAYCSLGTRDVVIEGWFGVRGSRGA